MMKWITERDSLVAQTKAFVQSVTGRRSEAAAGPSGIELNRTESVRIEAPEFIAQPVPAQPPTLFEPIKKVEQAVVPILERPPARTRADSEVRKEIQSRVAAFQAHQHRFQREREAYFKSVLTKARSSLDRDGDDGNHDEPSA